MADQLAPVLWRAVDSNGDPVASAEANWYESGTSTPLTVYQEDALSTPHASPQVADSSGIFDQVFVTAGTAAKVVVTRPSGGATLYTIDPVPLTSTGGVAASTISFSPVTGNSATDTQAAIESNTGKLNNRGALPTSTGSGGAFVVASVTAITAYASGLEYEFRANHASVGSGTDTLNVDSVGATVIKKLDSSNAKTDLAASDIAIGSVVRVKHDGTHWIIVSPVPGTSSVPGVVEFLDEDDMASDSATAAPSQQSVKAYVYGSGVGGSGQTWQDVSGSRVASTSYQNTTGQPIQVSITGRASSSAKNFEVSADNSTWVTVGRLDQTDVTSDVYVVVPDTWYYRINGAMAVIYHWAELR